MRFLLWVSINIFCVEYDFKDLIYSLGTYVDPRIIPGFHYKVRPNDRKDPLFGGRALKLCSIGMGYAKRLTFEPDSLIEPNNYLWSDNHPDGLGLEPRAVHTGMRFSIKAEDHHLGEATVFRADLPQQEERMEKVGWILLITTAVF